MEKINHEKISVVMTTYNGEKYICNQIDTILNQTLPVDEIIISDDNSTDSTLEIIKEYEAKYPFIRSYTNEISLGPNGNFRKAFSYATGDLILPCDQDDIWYPNKVELLYCSLSEEYDLVYGQDKILTETEEFDDIWYIPSIDVAIYKNRLKGHTCMFRKKLIELYQYSGCMSWDYVLSMYVCISGRGKALPDVLMYWRRHTDAVTFGAFSGEKSVVVEKKQTQMNKYKTFFIANKLIANGYYSEPIKKHMFSRAKYLEWLLASNYVLEKYIHEVTICKNILLNLSNQTLYSMFKAGCGSVKLYTYMSDFSSFKLLPKIARVFWAFRKPYEEWYSNHTEKYLG